MKQKIYKYPLESSDNFHLILPKDAQILCVQIQNEVPCIWALVEPESKQVERRLFEILCTGQEIEFDENRKYIGTFQFNNKMRLVYHLFETLTGPKK